MRTKIATMVFLGLVTVGIAGGAMAGQAVFDYVPRYGDDPIGDARLGYCAAIRSMDAQRIADCYSPKGQLVLPGMKPLKGREAIRKFLAPMSATMVVDSTTMNPDRHAGRLVSGSLTEWGTYRQVAGPKDGPHELHTGRYECHYVYSGSPNSWWIETLTMLPTPAAPAPDSSSGPPPAR